MIPQSLKAGSSGEIDFIQGMMRGTRNPMNAPPRDELIRLFKNKRQEIESVCLNRFSTTTTTKSTLTKDLSRKKITELQLVAVRDLLVETIHHGKVLIGRIIAPPFKVNAIQLLLEDQVGGGQHVVQVSIYNYVLPGKKRLGLELDTAFPVGAIVARMWKLFKMLIIHITNEAWKQVLQSKLPKDIDGDDGWRVRGNKYYTDGDYERALDYYNRGLEIDPHHTILAQNKTAALVALKRYQECIKLSLSLISRSTAGVNEKVCARLAKSYYGVGLYQESLETYQQLLTLLPNSSEARTHITKCKERLVELEQGVYNFTSLKSEYKLTKQIDCSEYIGPVKVIHSEEKGRGLVVTQDVPVGTLMMVSHGIGVFIDKMEGKEQQQIIYNVNFRDKQAFDIVHTNIVSLTNSAIKNNPYLGNLVGKLYAGPNYSVSNQIEVDEFRVTKEILSKTPTVPSIEQIQNIVKYNAFKSEVNNSNIMDYIYYLRSSITLV
ncbi:hypothetical protein CYY_005187 [Polysphondylium violaceum]|uniref:Uncharacterized protein n=1 Tax=Polysphondylium violaceum TaxID=133409 RepID=A0A8J4PTU1_9MYCE|nr:hypothetical protein CYY_005187 [Polysphondylium violaceum]